MRKVNINFEDFLTGTQSQLRKSIDNLINPPRNRLLTTEQWWKKCLEIDAQIKVSIKNGRVPLKFEIAWYVASKKNYINRLAITREDYIRQFQAIADYLDDEDKQPDHVRAQNYRSDKGLD